MKKLILIPIIIGLVYPLTSFAQNEIDRYINSINTLPISALDNVIESNGESRIEEKIIDGIKYKCVFSPKKMTEVFDEVAALSPNTGVLYPGAIVKGNSLYQNVLTPVNIKRGSGRITISYFQSNEPNLSSNTLLLKKSTFQEFEDQKNVLLNRIPGPQVARISFNKSEGYSLEQSMLSVGLTAKWASGSVKAGLQKAFSSESSKYVVKVVQSYYDISYEPETRGDVRRPSDFFRENVSISSVKSALGDAPDSPPAYVKSVTYGRMLFLIFESNSSMNDLKASVEAAFRGGTTSISANLSAEQKTIISNSNITVLALGGAADAVIKLLTAGNKIDDLNKYLQDGANYSKNSPAYPISYSLRYLKNDEIARLQFNTTFEVAQCDKDPKKISKISIKFWNIMDNKDKENSISFYVLKNKVVIGQLTDIGGGVEWQKGTTEEWAVPIDGRADELDKHVLVVRVAKNGSDKGFSCKPFSINVHFADGTEAEWRKLDDNFIMGDGHANVQDTRF